MVFSYVRNESETNGFKIDFDMQADIIFDFYGENNHGASVKSAKGFDICKRIIKLATALGASRRCRGASCLRTKRLPSGG